MKRQLSVSAVMIACNEQRFLPGCLRSLRGLVDEVIVVDTGSIDDTAHIATEAGAKLFHHVWEYDFSAARNVALSAASGDWLLYLDADERLTLPDGGRVCDYLDPAAIAGFVRFRPKTGYTRYREWRLFRRDPRIRFAGKIHETMVPTIREVSLHEGLPVVQTAVEIDHLGYDGDQSHKHARNLPLLQAAVSADPDRAFLWYHFTETLTAIGRVKEAEAAAAEGLASAERNPGPEALPAASMISQFLARTQMARSENPFPVIEAGLARFPDDFALLFLQGKAYLDAGNPTDALRIAEILSSIDPDSLTDGLLAFDRRIFEEKASELAALACLRLGRRADAAEHFVKAAAYAPKDLGYRAKAAALGTRPLPVMECR